MNTKKITALALAALMAAGSTSTVFADAADKDKALTFGSKGILYGEDDGVIVKDADNEFNPGDTIYVELKADKDATDKEIDRMKVYADWKVGGDHIESIDILYKKGETVSNGIVTGAKEYTVSIGGRELKISADEMAKGAKAAIKDRILKEMKKDENFLKDERAAAISEVKTGFVIAGNYVASGYTEKSTGLIAADKHYDTEKDAADAIFTTDGNNLTGLWVLTEDKDASKAIIRAKNTNSDPGDGKHSDESVSKGSYKANGTGADILVTKDTATVKEADLIEHNLAEKVAAPLLVKSDKSFVKVDAQNYAVNEQTPAYSYGGTTYVTKAEAQAKADEAIADTEADELSKQVVKAVDSSISSTGKAGYTYWVEIKTKDSDSTKELDVAGTLYLGTSKNKAEDKKNEAGIDFTLSNRVEDYNKPGIVEDEYTFEADKNGAVKFSDDAEEVTLYFGANEDAWFTFNAKGQGALNFGYTLKFNKEIADLFPKANIDFISWNAEPATNRTGDLYITADEDTFLYEVTENGIKEVKGAKYDEDEGAWHIRTRKLTSYAVSDIELDTTVKVEGKDDASSNSSTSSKPNGDKHNPNTGR